ncbi:MAG: FtsX-like permease family protein [Thermoproteota archaeon]
MGSHIEASISNYSQTITFIGMDHFDVTGTHYAVIPSNLTATVQSMPHVRKLHKLYLFYLAFVERDSNINILGFASENFTLFIQRPAAIYGLGELPPFLIDIRKGRLPLNGSEIAVTGTEDHYKVEDTVEVAFEGNITEVEVSGVLTSSLLSPAQLIVHKDLLLRMPGGMDVLDAALEGDCTALFVEVDSIYHVEEVLEEIRGLLEADERFEIVYDEYLLKKTLELNDRGELTVRLLNFGSLSFSALLMALVSYVSINLRRWEVGLLRSMGFSNNEIKGAYLWYSSVVAVFGVVAAFSAAYLVGAPIENLILNALNLGNIVSATALQLTSTTIFLAFTLAIIISAASILLSITLALRRPIEDQLREF